MENNNEKIIELNNDNIIYNGKPYISLDTFNLFKHNICSILFNLDMFANEYNSEHGGIDLEYVLFLFYDFYRLLNEETRKIHNSFSRENKK